MTTRDASVAAAAVGTEPVVTPSVSWLDRVQAQRWEIVRWLSPLVVLLAWQAGSAWGIIDPAILPAPQTIAEAGVELIGNVRPAPRFDAGRPHCVLGGHCRSSGSLRRRRWDSNPR